jgi:hypothetical protein
MILNGYYEKTSFQPLVIVHMNFFVEYEPEIVIQPLRAEYRLYGLSSEYAPKA